MRVLFILIAGLLCLATGRVLDHWIKFGTLSSFAGDLVLYQELINELGIALVIGCVIAFTIEKISRKELNKAIENRIDVIQRNVFRATYQRNLPGKILDEIENLVFASSFMRKGLLQVYDMKRVFAPELASYDETLPKVDVIKCRSTTTYSIENITQSEQVYVLRSHFELPPFEPLRKYSGFESISVGGTQLSLADATQSVTEQVFSISVPIRLGAGETTTVRVAWTMFKLLDDVEFWQSMLLSDGMILRARLPDRTVEYGAAAIHRSTLKPAVVSGDGYREWRIDEGVLPHQGIIFWWRSDTSPAPTGPQDTANSAA